MNHTTDKYILTMTDLTESDSYDQIIGGKALGLARLLRLAGMGKCAGQFAVPAFFVIGAGANLLQKDIQSEIESRVKALLETGTTETTSAQRTNTLSQPEFAVRSSCLCEDQKATSFAGQYQSFLSVPAHDVLTSARDVIKSTAAINLDQYRKLVAAKENLDARKNEMAVLVQLMVEPQVAGVAFSSNPVSGSADEIVINSVDGLAEDLVQGLVDGEQIVVKASQIERTGGSAIEDKAILELARISKELEQLYGFAVDIEWAIQNDTIYILQVRPISTATSAAASVGTSAAASVATAVANQRETGTQGMVRIFDGSNIQESYPSVTTPMTFSFVRRAYRDVYRSFVRLMGVSDTVIGQNEDIFSSMLGYIDGHIYYNMGSWYRLLALLPAYKTNRTFMEKMMGLKDPAAEVSTISNCDERVSVNAKIGTFVAAAHVIGEYLKLRKSTKEFYLRLDRVLSTNRSDLKTMDLDTLCRLYRSLEMELLTKWDAPIVNDFFAMIFFGIHQNLVGKNSSSHSLIEGVGNVISARPPQIIKEIAAQIKGDSALIVSMLQNKNVDQLFACHTEAYAQYLAYLDEFGDRSIGELKLESESVRDNPALLLATIATVAKSYEVDSRPELKVVAKAQAQNPIKGMAIRLIAKPARELIAGRENLRFARTRVFGLVRDIINTMAERLVESGQLDHKRDIYHLEIEEVLGFVEGLSTCKNLRGLIALRRAEELKYIRVIPDRVRTLGAVGAFAVMQSLDLSDKPEKQNEFVGNAAPGDKSKITGLPACSGTVRGRARVIKNPATEHLLAGEILVAERTDPGWIMHFALCKGIVTSYGSMLSHTAIVARELQLPAVVSAKGAFELIESGDLIEVDGGAGVVTIIEKHMVPKEESQWALRA